MILNFIRDFISPVSPEKTAEDIMWKIAGEAFVLFREKEFRELLELEKLEQTEQDRIFNEVVLTGLSMVYLMFETLEGESRDAKKELFRIVKNHFHGAYPRRLRELGSEEEHVQLWFQLMAMRCEEYRKDYQRYKKVLPEVNEGNPWIPVASIGGKSHIRRGKIIKDDRIFLLMNQWCTNIAIEAERAMVKLIDRLN